MQEVSRSNGKTIVYEIGTPQTTQCANMIVLRYMYQNVGSVIFFKNNKVLIQKDLSLYVY